MKKIRKIIFGEKTPEITDPGYEEKGRRAQEAGEKFTRFMRLDKLASVTQTFASRRPVLFLVIVFGIATFFFSINAARLFKYGQSRRIGTVSVVEQRDSLINQLINDKE